MITVLFACVQNAGRSQMAAAIFTREADPAKARAVSAGTRPAAAVHPEVASTLAELGLDVSGARPQRLTDALASQAQVLVTMGCGEACPVVPGARVVGWEIADPHGQPPDAVRAIRDQIAGLVGALVDELGVGRGT